MSKTVERYQNPVVGNVVNLRLLVYRTNGLSDVHSIQKVQIYRLDENSRTAQNPDGRVLVEEFDGSSVASVEEGVYLLPVHLAEEQYHVGRYLDIWTLNVELPYQQTVEHFFDVVPDMWFTTPVPIVYDFTFRFRPNRVRKGSRQYLVVEVTPNVPRASDLKAYYEYLAIGSVLGINIANKCDPCAQACDEPDLIVDNEVLEYREKHYAYYKLDTTDMDYGVYDVWFRLEFGDNVFISEKNQLQVY